MSLRRKLKNITSVKTKKSERAARKLAKSRDVRVVQPLIAMLKDGNNYVRATAAYVLGEICDTQAIQPLLKAIQDGNEEVRSASALALGMIKDAHTIHRLTPMLRDKDSSIKTAAEENLKALGYEWAAEITRAQAQN